MEIDLTTIGRSLRLLRSDHEIEQLLRLCVSGKSWGRNEISKSEHEHVLKQSTFSATSTVVYGPGVDAAGQSDSGFGTHDAHPKRVSQFVVAHCDQSVSDCRRCLARAAADAKRRGTRATMCGAVQARRCIARHSPVKHFAF